MLHCSNIGAPGDMYQAAGHVWQAMFAARKRVFVDLLKWDVPVIDGRFEMDQFDDEYASYLLFADADGTHIASARILPTTRPHILGSLFPQLCTNGVPTGPAIREVTRFCIDPALDRSERREARDHLVHALVRHALGNGINTYTAVAEASWCQQILEFGWHCEPLGLIEHIGTERLIALRIDIDEETPELLAEAGICAHQEIAATASPETKGSARHKASRR